MEKLLLQFNLFALIACVFILKDQTYGMDRPNLGHAVIINNIHSGVPGSQVDVELLVECYKTVGFNVQVHKDWDTQVLFWAYYAILSV